MSGSLIRYCYLHSCSANAKWPFAFSHNRLQTGGWARQQNSKHRGSREQGRLIAVLTFLVLLADVMPIATCEFANGGDFFGTN